MWFVGRLGRSSPQDRAKFLKLAALYGAVGILLFLILTGRLHGLFALLAAFVPLIQRVIMLRSAYSMFKNWQGPVQGSKTGQTSDVKTRYFNMTLDHDTGEITGNVLRGTYKGYSLVDLDIEQLGELWIECRRKDHQSASVLETYLDRMRPEEWEEYAQEYAEHEQTQGTQSQNMTRAEALEVLGLEEGATREEIIQAHRTLMQKNHPDRGGSTWVAARINQAKDLLLS